MKDLSRKVFSTTLGKVCLGIFVFNILLCLYNLFKISHYFSIGIIGGLVFILILLFLLLFVCTLHYPKVSVGMNIVLCVLLIVSSLMVNRISTFSSHITNTKEIEVIEIVVSKDSQFNENSDLSGKVLASYIEDDDGLEKARIILDDHHKEGVQEKRYDDMKKAYQDVLDGKVDMLVFSPLSTSLIEEELENENKTRVLFSKEFEINNLIKTSHKDISKEPFVMYLGGVDLSSNGKVSGSGRGDVNILLVVNPITKKTLLQVVPRDLYSYNPVKKKRSKLSWSGKWGGVQSSIYSIEHELGIKIDYYAKITFDGFKDLIDSIGGIDVYSHYTFDSNQWGGFYHYDKGYNHLDGEAALRFARSRKMLPENDISRGIHQTEVIKAIFKKVSENPTYSYLNATLEAIEKNFMTSLPEDQFDDAFYLFMNMQDAFVNIDTYTMEGKIKWHDDEIIGGYYYYFYPNDGEIEKVRNRINDVLLDK